jgi:hypothetical protein
MRRLLPPDEYLIRWFDIPEKPENLASDEFWCSNCYEVCKQALTDEEAKKQFEAEFPGLAWNTDLPIVCQTCFDKMENKGGKEYRENKEYLLEEIK